MTSPSNKNVYWRNYGVSLLVFISSLSIVVFAVPVQMDLPTISNLKPNSFDIGFTPISDAVKYHVIVAAKHSDTVLSFIVTSSGSTISGLQSNTLYQVSVKGEDSAGEVGPDGNFTNVHTNPGAPTIRTSDQFPDSTFVFFHSNNYARISRWVIEYREFGSNVSTSMNTPSRRYFVYRLSGLSGNTTYEIRARAAELYYDSETSLADANVEFSPWQIFTTASHLVFGRVIINNVVYTSSHSTKDSDEWNSVSTTINDAYSFVSHNGISILRIDERNGNPLVYYQIKVKDKNLPAPTNYILSGSEFTNSTINNGDSPVGTPLMSETWFTDRNKYTLEYRPLEGSDCKKVIDRYIYLTREDGSTSEIHLNVASGETTPADESNALTILYTGQLENDNGAIGDTVPPNVVLGLVPKFLILDCVNGSSDTESIYSQLLVAAYEGPEDLLYHRYYTTNILPSVINETETTYTSSFDGTSVTLNVKSVDKAIQYEILDGDKVVATLESEDIDGSPFLKIVVDSVENGSTYNFRIRVEARQQDGLISVATSTSAISVTPNSDQCNNYCGENADCTTAQDGSIDCFCKLGFLFNGDNCEAATTTEPTEPTPEWTTTETTTSIDTTTTMTTPVPATTPECSFESSANSGFVPTLFSSITESSIHVSWAEVLGVSVYSVSWTCMNCTDAELKTRSTFSQELHIDELEAGMHYNICISANVCFSNKFQLTTYCVNTPTVPSSITDVKVTTFATSVHLTWESPRGATYTEVTFENMFGRRKRSLENGSDIVLSNSHTIVDLSPDTTYLFSVTAGNVGGKSTPYQSQFTTKSVATTTAATTASYHQPTNFTTTSPTTTTETPSTATTQLPSTTEHSADYTTSMQTEAYTDVFTIITTAVVYTTEVTYPVDLDTLPSVNITATSDAPTTISSTLLPKSTTGKDAETTGILSTSDIISTSAGGLFNRGVPWWFIFAIVIAGLVLLFCLVAIIYYCRKRGQEEQGV